jgi:membrane protease YdiL (CAAX protease family)
MDNDTRLIRQDVRRVCLGVAGFILLMSLISFAVIIIAVVMKLMDDPQIVDAVTKYSFNWVDHVDLNVIQDQIFDSVGNYSGIASIFGMVLALPIFFIIRGKKFVTSDITTKNSKVKASTIIVLFVMILGVQFGMLLIQVVLEPLINSGGGSLTDELNETTTQLAMSFWGVLYIAFIGPICEELVFRGAVMRKLEKHGANFAIITSALLFGLYHVILFQAVFAFFIGVIFAYTAGRFSLKWSILLHILNNSLAVITVYFNSDVFNIALGIVYLLAFIATIIILIAKRREFTAQKADGAAVVPSTFMRAYSSPWIIIYAALCLIGGSTMLGLG